MKNIPNSKTLYMISMICIESNENVDYSYFPGLFMTFMFILYINRMEQPVVRGLPFHNQGGVRVFTLEYNFFFCPNESTIFFFFQNESTIFFLLPIRPLFYYMTKREWYYGFASAASAYDFWRKKNYRVHWHW